MKVLWFEVTVPGKFKADGAPIAGWQDSLEYIVKQHKDIELTVAFQANSPSEAKVVDGIKYYPMFAQFSFLDKVKNYINCSVVSIRDKIIPLSLEVIKDVKPDVIHVFGSEWCFGQVAEYTKIPVVIHMQGSIPQYMNCKYPPGYNEYSDILSFWYKPKRIFNYICNLIRERSWIQQEIRNLKTVSNYMGRTTWDKTMVDLFHPGAKYFYCSEALRPSFIQSERKWNLNHSPKKRFITVGCGTYWKGLDMALKTAKILKEYGFNFEWLIAGQCNQQNQIEKRQKTTFAENNIKLLGYTNADRLVELELYSDLYVHTAYIDNSPNSICEAQYMGMPVISTNVGGISTLVSDGVNGILVPSNDPYMMAYNIMTLLKDEKRLISFSESAYNEAHKRHNPETIYSDLLNCYKFIISK